MKTIAAAGLSVLLVAASAVTASGEPEMILFNGRIVTLDDASRVAEALAIEGDSIVSVGSNDEVRALEGAETRMIDLDGRTVIPGLIDSHMHAIRAGLTYGIELDWTGVASLEEGLQMIDDAVHGAPADRWVLVAGGWQENQFPERRGPTPDELAEIAPDHPVYIQHMYQSATLNPKALEILKLTSDEDVPPGGKLERGPDGKPTGFIQGNVPTFATLYNKIPQPDLAGQVEGTRAYFRRLNSLGLTGANDVAGGGLLAEHYRPLFQIWRDGDLSLRIVYHFQSQKRGAEVDDIKATLPLLPRGFGDDMLRFNGIGEVIIWSMHDGDTTGPGFQAPEEGKAALKEVARWAAEQGIVVHMHASSDGAAQQILDIFEEVHQETPIDSLRWVIPHIEDASLETMRRMKALGMGFAVQNRLYYQGDRFLENMGEQAARRAPPIKTALAEGLMVAGGTDSHRVAPYNPFVSLEWLVTGRSNADTEIRGREESPSREEALRIYTINSAWMAFDEERRGTLEPGTWADLAVLSNDYFAVPETEISEIESVLTIVGGRIVYAADPYGDLDPGL
jgi:predicted amidohydrolase YtcJ